MATPTSLVAMPTLLAVDDTPENLHFLNGILQKSFRVKVANSGERALLLVQGNELPDIILLDVVMPGLDGYQVCEQLKANPRTANIPVIFLTARTEIESETRGFECGAVDYIGKPFVAPVVLARVKAQLELKKMADFLRDQKDFLEQEVVRRTREITAIQDVTILAMASLAETRDDDTGNHIRRTQNYVRALAIRLQKTPRFAAVLSDLTIEMLFKSAPLHDIGKVGIPDHILLKPGRLTPEEFEVMKTHTTIGRDSIQHAEDALGLEVEFLRIAKEIAYCHQEKWDGSGYPNALKGEAIPLAARLMAVADVYDALISKRVYKAAMGHEEAVQIILEGKGRHFDPDITDAFVEIADEFREIACRYADDDN